MSQLAAPVGLRVGDLFEFVDLVGATLSHDGQTVAYVSSKVNPSHDKDVSEVWVLSGAEGVAQNLHLNASDIFRPAISPDGSTLAFLAKGAGQVRQIFACGIDGNNLVQVTHLAGGAGALGPRWSPDGRTIAFDGHYESPRDPKKPYRVTRPLWRRDGIGLVDEHTTDLFLVSATGGEARRLTEHDGMISSFEWSRDGSSLLYVSLADPTSLKQFIRFADVRSGAVTLVEESDFLIYPPSASWLPDGRVVHTTRFDVSKELDLLVFDPTTGQRESRAPNLGGQIFGHLQSGGSRAALEPRIVVDEDGTSAYVPVQRGGTCEVDRVALSGEIKVEPAVHGQRSCFPIAISGSTLLFADSDFDHPLDLKILDISHGTERQLTHLNEALLTGTPELIVHDLWWKGVDGVDVEGWFVEPVSAGGGPHPTVVHLHGGPFAGQGYIFNLTNHILASAGYGIFMVNFRGSSGYGEEFAKTLHGEWGTHDYSDTMAGIDRTIELKLADPDRLGSFGGSGGGFMTVWNLTHTDRFKAGVAECPAVGFNEMLASDIAPVMGDWAGAAPGSGVDGMRPYLRMSPNTYSGNCKTPLLIIVHELDIRCPINQADALYNTLTLNGAHVEMLRVPGIFHGGSHEVGNPPARLACLEGMVDWMRSYLGGSGE